MLWPNVCVDVRLHFKFSLYLNVVTKQMQPYNIHMHCLDVDVSGYNFDYKENARTNT